MVHSASGLFLLFSLKYTVDLLIFSQIRQNIGPVLCQEPIMPG
ncbi:hypothetical protein ANACOL_03309 [Anaerotruncus colihominis DSM 17241]|uniref:Uncharacterized protein n=1 Tax=Anaerotruncus colihominis DSM 17241 TaxID=445972 RepID=B0PET1_9FIRM|nr:hypothetical protein ANACOL_03309 [Anaerotruncus colihominis DSM 17241]